MVISSEGMRPLCHFERRREAPGVEKSKSRVPRLGAEGGAELSRGAIKRGRVQKERRGGESRETAQETSQKCMKSETFCVYQSEKSKPIKLY